MDRKESGGVDAHEGCAASHVSSILPNREGEEGQEGASDAAILMSLRDREGEERSGGERAIYWFFSTAGRDFLFEGMTLNGPDRWPD